MKRKITNYKVFALNTHWTLFLLCSALLAFPVLGLPCMISMALNIRHNYTQLIFVSACCIAASTVLGTLFLHFQKKAIYDWNLRIRNSLIRSILFRSDKNPETETPARYTELFEQTIPHVQKNILESSAAAVFYTVLFVGALISSFIISASFTAVTVLSGTLFIMILRIISASETKARAQCEKRLKIYRRKFSDGLLGSQTLCQTDTCENFMQYFSTWTSVTQSFLARSSCRSGMIRGLMLCLALLIQYLLICTGSILVSASPAASVLTADMMIISAYLLIKSIDLMRTGQRDVTQLENILHLSAGAKLRCTSAAVAPQQTFIFDATLLQNIVMFQPECTIDYRRVKSAVSAAGLDSLIRTLPHGIRSELSYPYSDLSDDTREKIGRARLIYASHRTEHSSRLPGVSIG